MSRQIANVNLSAATVGTTGKITIPSMPPTPIAAQMAPQRWSGATLILLNESGCGLTCMFPVSQETFTLAAGHWKQIHVPPDEAELDYTVAYVVPNQLVSQLFADLYLPGEVLDSVGSLGNSPFAMGGTLSTYTQQRLVSVPIAPLGMTSRGQTLTVGQDIMLRLDGLGATPPGGSVTPSIYLYLYYCCVRLINPGSVISQNADLTLWADIMSNSTVEGSVALHNIFVLAATANGNSFSMLPHDFQPAVPAAFFAHFNFSPGLPPPLTGVQWRLHVNAEFNSPAAWWDIGVGVDIVNSVSPGTHGNFSPNAGIF